MCYLSSLHSITGHLGEKFLLFKSHFRTVASYENLGNLQGLYPTNGATQNEQEISGMCTYFRVVMET